MPNLSDVATILNDRTVVEQRSTIADLRRQVKILERYKRLADKLATSSYFREVLSLVEGHREKVFDCEEGVEVFDHRLHNYGADDWSVMDQREIIPHLLLLGYQVEEVVLNTFNDIPLKIYYNKQREKGYHIHPKGTIIHALCGKCDKQLPIVGWYRDWVMTACPVCSDYRSVLEENAGVVELDGSFVVY